MAWPNGTYRVSDKTTGNGTGYLEVLPDFAQDMTSMVSSMEAGMDNFIYADDGGGSFAFTSASGNTNIAQFLFNNLGVGIGAWQTFILSFACMWKVDAASTINFNIWNSSAQAVRPGPTGGAPVTTNAQVTTAGAVPYGWAIIGPNGPNLIVGSGSDASVVNTGMLFDMPGGAPLGGGVAVIRFPASSTPVDISLKMSTSAGNLTVINRFGLLRILQPQLTG
jgi:hypothetical protein